VIMHIEHNSFPAWTASLDLIFSMPPRFCCFILHLYFVVIHIIVIRAHFMLPHLKHIAVDMKLLDLFYGYSESLGFHTVLACRPTSPYLLSRTHARTHARTHIHTHTHTPIYLYSATVRRRKICDCMHALYW